MRGWFGCGVLLLSLAVGQLDLDCSRPGQARGVIGRLMLAEIEGAKHRRMLPDFEERCRSSISRVPSRLRGAS
jgi:hypothetical protein